MIRSRTARRQRRAGRLLDEHGSHLMALASMLTATRARAERLVIDAVAAQSRRHRRDSLRTRRDLSSHLHARWLATHGSRPPSADPLGQTDHRDLSDLQLGLLALVLFSGYTYAHAGRTLRLTPLESATTLRDSLRLLAT